jgi:endonuclease G
MRRLLIFCVVAIAWISPSVAGEIFCKHFLHGQPNSTVPNDNDLVIRDCYALSNNAKTKFADWVAFRLTPQEVFGTLDLARKWRNDDWLGTDKTLKATPKKKDEYRDALQVGKDARRRGYERGHLAPLASFRGSRDASQVNFYSNIVPQNPDLNEGLWEHLEQAVRRLAIHYQYVWVITGPLYEGEEMPKLPHARAAHKVPSHLWQIVMIEPNPKDPRSLRAAAFVFKNAPPPVGAKLVDHLRTIREMERRTGLNFLHRLPPERRDYLKTLVDRRWVEDEFERKSAFPPRLEPMTDRDDDPDPT